MLTDTAVKKAKPADKPYKLTDSQGLILYVMPTGSKSWRLRYRHDGKERQLVFGPYPDLSLADAREERDRARKLLREGRDPSIERRSRAAAAATAAAHTFEKVAREWYETNKGQWAERHAWDVMNSLERDIFPALGQVPIAEIEPPVVLNALRRVEEGSRRDGAAAAAAHERGVRVRHRLGDLQD